MTPEERNRFALLSEKQFAGDRSEEETSELSRLLEHSCEAFDVFLKSLGLHLALGNRAASKAETPPVETRERRNPMARIALNCSCSWNFFIPGTTTGHEVVCPSCGQGVRIPGRAPGRDLPLSPGEVAARVLRRQAAVRSAVGLGIAAAVAAGAMVYFISSSKIDPVRPDEPKVPPLIVHVAAPPAPSKVEIPAFSAAPATGDPKPLPVVQWKADLAAAVWRCNLTGMISEIMRYRGLQTEHQMFQQDHLVLEQRIRDLQTQLEQADRKIALDPYLTPGDQILGLDDTDFSELTPAEAARLLHAWVTNVRFGSSTHRVYALRGDRILKISLPFPQETKELLSLMRHEALQLPPSPESFIPGMVKIPDAVLAAVTRAFDELTPGYRDCLGAADSKRLSHLLARKIGASEDVPWLKIQVLEKMVPAFRREAETLKARIPDLEAKIASTAATDILYRKGGGKVEGKVVEQTPDFVKVKSRFGTITIPAAEILRIETGKGVAAEFGRKLAQAKQDLEAMIALLAWCNSNKLVLEKELVATLILTRDASNLKARVELGIAIPPPPK